MIALPENYGYVIIALGVQCLVTLAAMINVGNARKSFNIMPPIMYAPDDHKHAADFNRIQRAHQNTLEYAPTAMILAAINGFVCPIISAVLMGVFAVGRLVFIFGYKVSAKGRLPGFLISTMCGYVPLILLSFYSGVISLL